MTMFNDTAVTTLRLTDRKRLLHHMSKLSHVDPQQRADAALAATELLEAKGLSWSALVPLDRTEVTGTAPGGNWQALALALTVHHGVSPSDQAYAHKVAGWKSPGVDGMARLRSIADQVGLEAG